MTNDSNSYINYTAKELITRLEGKLDAYHKELGIRIHSLEKDAIKLETAMKTWRIWGLVVLLAGGAGGQILARMVTF